MHLVIDLMEYLYYIGTSIKEYASYLYPKKKYSSEEIYNLIKNLRNIQETIVKRMDFIDTNINKFLIKSRKEYSKKNKKSAINFLKIKKLYEYEKEKLESVNFNIEVQIMSVESMGLMIETSETLKNTSIKIKSINNNFDVDKIESTIEELQDNTLLGQELQDIISIPMDHEFDEEEKLKELENQNNIEITQSEIINVNSDIVTIYENNIPEIIKNMPTAPTTSIIKDTKIAIKN